MASFRNLLPLALVVSLSFLVPGPLAEESSGTERSSGIVVSRWLVIGPALDSLPAFHEEKPGGYGLEDLLDADHFTHRNQVPREESTETWFGTEPLQWTARDTGEKGRVTLGVPEGAAEGRPAVAWLAFYLQTDSWQAMDLEVQGSHLRRAWLDGEVVATGGGKDDEDEARGRIKLTPGKHLVLIQTVFDPSGEEDWWVRASLDGGKKTQMAKLDLTLNPQREFTILDITDAPRITSAAVSPNGKAAAVVVRRILPGTDQPESWVEVRSVENSRVRQMWRGFEIRDVAWAPEEERISYVTREKKEGKDSKSVGSLWIADLGSGKVDLLLERVENLSGYQWSPDGQAIVYWSTVDPEPDKSGIKKLENLLDRQARHRTKSYLHLVTVPGGVRRRLTAGSASTIARDFSPDGKRLLFTRQFDDVRDRPYTRSELWEMDLKTFEAKRLRESRWFVHAQYSPDGKKILVQAGPSEFEGAGANLPEGFIANEYDHQLYIWDPVTDVAEPITRNFDPAVREAVWSRNDKHIYLRAEDRDFIRLFRYSVKRKEFTRIGARFQALERLDAATRAPVALVTGTSPWIPQGLVAVDLRHDEAKVIYWPAGDWFSRVQRGKTEPWKFTASNGRTIEGRVYLPPDFDSSARYPCIVYYYGGTSPTSRGFGGRYPKEYWAAMGYVVYVLQPSGATGFGQAFSSLHVNDWGEIVSEEIIEGVKKFLEAHPYVDPERVGCIGASFGGFMTMRLVTKTDLFAAAVSHAGISFISSYWGEGYWGYAYSAIATAHSFPWNRSDIYLDRSPLSNVDKVKTPILLTHGTADTNVPVGESDTFYTALKLVGAPVEYVQVKGEDHWIVDHDKRVLWSRTIVAWFDRWLKDRPEWWNDLYPERE